MGIDDTVLKSFSFKNLLLRTLIKFDNSGMHFEHLLKF